MTPEDHFAPEYVGILFSLYLQKSIHVRMIRLPQDKACHEELIFRHMTSELARGGGDLRIQCSDGAVWAHRLVLASISRN